MLPWFVVYSRYHSWRYLWIKESKSEPIQFYVQTIYFQRVFFKECCPPCLQQLSNPSFDDDVMKTLLLGVCSSIWGICRFVSFGRSCASWIIRRGNWSTFCCFRRLAATFYPWDSHFLEGDSSERLLVLIIFLMDGIACIVKLQLNCFGCCCMR